MIVVKIKKYLYTSFLFLWQLSFSQNLDSLGLNNDPILNQSEASFLNTSFSSQTNEFDFINKKIAFALGSSNYKIRTKASYFKEVIAYYRHDEYIEDILIVLDEKEKILSGGYDAIIVSWSKIGVGKKARQKLVKKLRD